MTKLENCNNLHLQNYRILQLYVKLYVIIVQKVIQKCKLHAWERVLRVLAFVSKFFLGGSDKSVLCLRFAQQKYWSKISWGRGNECRFEINVHRTRVARWFVFKPKIQIWVNFGGSWNGRCWYILWTLGPFYGFCYILWKFGIVRGNLVYLSHFGILYEEKPVNDAQTIWC
jgi:hypothetical protein